MADSPYPDLQMYENSGLDFPWAETVTREGTSTFDWHLGADGTGLGMQIYVYWEDIVQAVQQLLGYSYRVPPADDGNGGMTLPRLSRVLPWQHPYFNQLYVKSINRVEAMQPRGALSTDPLDILADTSGTNLGPWSSWYLAKLTLSFYRPPYFVLDDASIQNDDGDQQEWLRYLDRNWSISTNILSREGSQFLWSGGYVGGLPGSVGNPITKLRMSRKWYQIPEAAIFGTVGPVGSPPNGLPTNLLYTQTTTVNPITGYNYTANQPIVGCVNTPIGTGYFTKTNCSIIIGTTTVFVANTVNIEAGIFVVSTTGVGITTGTVVIDPIVANTSFTISRPSLATGTLTLGFVSDNDDTLRMFGTYMGTLLFEGAELIPMPLQMPPALMQIPVFSDNEAISQQQYDVDFHWSVFDPPRGTIGGPGYARGHNLMPYSGDAFWYPVNSQQAVIGSSPKTPTTPFNYCDPSDLFQIL